MTYISVSTCLCTVASSLVSNTQHFLLSFYIGWQVLDYGLDCPLTPHTFLYETTAEKNRILVALFSTVISHQKHEAWVNGCFRCNHSSRLRDQQLWMNSGQNSSQSSFTSPPTTLSEDITSFQQQQKIINFSKNWK